MGLLRFILALAVIIAHSEPLFGLIFIPREMAVQSFYIISGFYMAFILNEKYVGPDSYKLFITNRFLRLYPVYWTIAGLTVVMAFISLKITGFPYMIRFYIKYSHLMNIKSFVYIIATNLFIVGQDSLSFLKLGPGGSLVFTSNFLDSGPQVYLFSLAPQAWTISLEILFYLIAPFIVRRDIYRISVIILLSLILRFYIYGSGLDHDPWTYRFFPTELAFFLFGAVSYKLYRILKTVKFSKRLYLIVFLTVISLTSVYQFIPAVEEGWFNINQWTYYLILVVSIPFIFVHSKNMKFDYFLGELSYPMYISHFLIFYMTTYYYPADLFEKYHYIGYLEKHHEIKYLGSILFIILFSALLVRFLIKPIERYRQSRVTPAP